MKVMTIIAGILLILVGIFCLFTPGLTFLSIGWLLGLMLLIAGIAIIVNYVAMHKTGTVTGLDLFMGILTAILGVLLLINQAARAVTDVMMVYLLGILMLVLGVIRIVQSIQASKVKGSGWGWILTLGILMVLLGVYSFFQPMVSALAIAWLIAFYLILAGVNLLAFSSNMLKTKDAEGHTHWTTST